MFNLTLCVNHIGLTPYNFGPLVEIEDDEIIGLRFAMALRPRSDALALVACQLCLQKLNHQLLLRGEDHQLTVDRPTPGPPSPSIP